MLNKVAGWPAIRSYNFDTNGNSSIHTKYQAFFTIPLIFVLILTFIYLGTPLIYYDMPIKTNIDIMSL